MTTTGKQHESTQSESERVSQKEDGLRSSSSTTTTGYTEPGVLNAIDLERVASAYVEILGPLNAVKAKILEQAMSKGMDAGAIIDAIEQTALAPRPSHNYLSAVLRRYMAQGITSAEAAAADRQRFAARRAAASDVGAWYSRPAAANPALNYAQREYTDDEFGEGFFIDLDKYAERV